MAAMFTSALLLPLNSFFDLPTTRHKCAQTHIESQLSTVYGFPITSFRIEWSRQICIQDAQCTIKLYQRFKSNHSSLAGLCHLCLFENGHLFLFLQNKCCLQLCETLLHKHQREKHETLGFRSFAFSFGITPKLIPFAIFVTFALTQTFAILVTFHVIKAFSTLEMCSILGLWSKSHLQSR